MNCATSPAIANAPLTVTRGESKTFLMTVRARSTKAPVDITGAKVWFSVKNRVEDVALIIAKRNLAAGGVDGQILITLPQVGASLGQAMIFLDHADTASLDPEASYVCDVWIQLTTSKMYQVVKNRKFRIDPSVTTSFL
jgi:hypothetical protein